METIYQDIAARTGGNIYIGVSGMKSMKKQNIPFTFAILFAFCVMASIANALVDYNYMFLVRSDGTPYDILYNLVGGNPILYPIMVIVLFLIYIGAFYGVYMLIMNRLSKKKTPEAEITKISSHNISA